MENLMVGRGERGEKGYISRILPSQHTKSDLRQNLLRSTTKLIEKRYVSKGRKMILFSHQVYKWQLLSNPAMNHKSFELEMLGLENTLTVYDLWLLSQNKLLDFVFVMESKLDSGRL